ncbi:MAG: lipid A core-O-antigen ligase-like enyme [Parcubacteria group bacterium Licking1014_17]|nr:MAG: lipid A core-O-antigen ligase-like enyme [Parcubacteria group bacterium Licking1014_17]
MFIRDDFINSFDYILYRIIRFGILFVPFISLVVIRNIYSPFEFSKGIVFRVITEIIFFIYVYLAFKYPNLRPSFFKKRPDKYVLAGLVALVVLVVWHFISGLFSSSWTLSFWGYIERMGGIFALLHYIAFFGVAASILRTRKEWENLIWASVAAALISSVYGILQKYSVSAVVGADQRFRIFGTVGNPAIFAGYLLFNFYFVLYLSSRQESKIRRFLLYFAAFIFASAIILSASRGAAAALIVSFVFLIFYILYKKSASPYGKKKSLIIAALAVVIIATIFSGIVLTRSGSGLGYFSRLTDFSVKSGSINSRLLVWGMALKGIAEKPVLGWGPENFIAVYYKKYDPKMYESPAQDYSSDRAHNIILDWLAAVGVVGLLSYLLIWYCAIRKIGARDYNDMPYFSRGALYAAAVAYFVFNCTFFDTTNTYLMVIFFMGLAFLWDDYVADGVATKVPEGNTPVNTVVGVLALVSCSILIIWANILPFLSNYYTNMNKRANSRGDFGEAFKYLELARNTATWTETDAVRNLTSELITALNTQADYFKNEDNRKSFGVIAQDLRDEMEKRPEDAASYTFLFKMEQILAANFGKQIKPVEDTIWTATAIFPKLIPLYYELYYSALIRNDFEGATNVANKILEIRQDLPFGKFWLAYVITRKDLNDKNRTKLRSSLNTLGDSFDSSLFNAGDNYGSIKPLLDELSYKLRKTGYYLEMRDLHLMIAKYKPSSYVYASYASYMMRDLKSAMKYADEALALDNSLMSSKDYETLADIYGALGDRKKQGEAYIKIQ